MSRPLRARIDLAALRHNLGVVRAHAPNSRVMAVIKANGYGHGVLRVASALETCEGFALLELNDAVRLREAGFTQRIVLLEGFFRPEELPVFAEYRLSPVIHSREQVLMLASTWLPSKLDVLLKLNTGMNRLGIAPAGFEKALEFLVNSPAVGQVTLMTHFACADEPEGVEEQFTLFRQVADGTGLPCCMANSAAILRHPETHADWVRPGIMLYGSSPFAGESAASLGLRPVMTLAGEIIGVQRLQAGERVGYGGDFEAEGPVRVATVACGYADGYPRHAPTGTPVLVGGREARLVGRVSMDMLAVDITDIPEASVGSPVVLWGEGLPVDEVARRAGTIGYELLCALAPRVPQVEVGREGLPAAP